MITTPFVEDCIKEVTILPLSLSTWNTELSFSEFKQLILMFNLILSCATLLYLSICTSFLFSALNIPAESLYIHLLVRCFLWTTESQNCGFSSCFPPLVFLLLQKKGLGLRIVDCFHGKESMERTGLVFLRHAV